ncbi:hypothetical protein [Pseudaestuariivita rosea]|uniref:hypothetical protein n=1 Tax=Pseudaestuariivita rosea TaxID=2763263 RepID=UPI001ABBBD7B|nr:hypothetical protein [Pseudaestuariivita rosea]
MSTFTLSLFYPLLHAFDETGRAMFRSEWTSWEAWARDYGDPDETRQKRRAIFDALNVLVGRENALTQVFVDQSDKEAAAIQNHKFQAIYKEQERLKLELHELPQVQDNWIKDHKAFQRRSRVEAELRDAFKQGELTLLFGPSTIVDWKRWANSTDFRVYFCLSMIRAPKNQLFGTRRAAALINRVEFDEWIKRFGVVPEGDGGLTAKAQCTNRLRAEVAKGQKRKTKDQYRAEMMDQIPGLSRRQFDRCWADETPDSWKVSGPFRK